MHAAPLKSSLEGSVSSLPTRAGSNSPAWEAIREVRVRRDYSLTRERLFDRLKSAVRDIKESEFTSWIEKGWFDRRWIDGEERFFNSSVSNLFFRHPELEGRSLTPRPTRALEMAYWENARDIRLAAQASGGQYVLPKRFEADMSVEVREEAVPDGATVRAWLPVPRRLPYQHSVEWMETSSPIQALAAPEHPIRAIQLEQVIRDAESRRFHVRYRFTAFGVWFDLKSNSAPKSESEGGSALVKLGEAGFKDFLGESPHVLAEAGVLKLAEEIGGGLADPTARARAYYEWISRNIRYSYAPEYSTIDNLGAMCRERGYGDCGQAAFLFMTLCRVSGIPARWQSGWSIFPGAETIHDWCEIYLPHHGWVPVDPYMGMYARQYTRFLVEEQREELAAFYFGGLSQYRMSANGDHNQELTPVKRDVRSDPVDFQRGEVEADGVNVYFDGFKWGLDWREVGL